MSDPFTLDDAQRTAASLATAVEALALRLHAGSAQLHAVRAAGMLDAAVRELGAAEIHDRRRGGCGAPPIVVTAVSPGADRPDELVRTIPADVKTLSPRDVAQRLGVAADEAGLRVVGAVMGRNGWRQLGFSGDWFRLPSDVAATLGQPR